MHINDPDALKGWLTIVLEPLCDADPPALARYVLALLKKEKPPKELSQCMAGQLDVFLGAETKSFLDRLFNVIKTEEYLKPLDELALPTGGRTTTDGQIVVGTTATTVVPAVTNITSDLVANKENHENTPPLLDTNVPVGGKPITKDVSQTKKTHQPPKSSSSSSALGVGAVEQSNQVQIGGGLSGPVTAIISPTISNSHEPSPPTKEQLIKSDKEGATSVTTPSVRDGRRRRVSLRSRSRSRSRSYERARRSRSRERRMNEREKNNRHFRNKSPPQIGGGSSRGSDRYGRRNNERSPRSYGRIRHRSNSASRSRSGSPTRHKISRSMSPSNDDGPPAKRMRCRDFDEKGYCMRGETCPWDHGVDPVVLEDINSPALMSSIQSGGGAVRAGVIHGEYNPDAPDMWNRGGFIGGPRGGIIHRAGAAGNLGHPRAPGAQFRGGPPFPFPVNQSATTPLQRELIPVPVVDGGSNGVGGEMIMGSGKRRFEPEDAVALAEAAGPLARRKQSLNNRLGPRPQQNCALELRKVPRGLNSIAHLNNHFSKFGKIYNIQIAYDGDPEAAIITFSSHAEANVAYRSTEAVLNNRFIKVFWHTQAGAGGGGAPSVDSPTPATIAAAAAHKEESQSRRIFTSQHTLSNIPAAPVSSTTESVNDADGKTSATTSSITSTTTTSGTTTNVAASASHINSLMNPTNIVQTPAQIRLKNIRVTRATNELIRKKQEEQMKNAVQIAQGLQKRKYDLLQGYLKQMKSAVELVEKVDASDPKRPGMLQTVKDLEKNIERLKKEIASDQEEISAQISQVPNNVKKSKEQQQKELLDMELELITQQQEGNDTTAIQKKLHELQRTYGITTPLRSSHFPPRTQRVRPAPPGSTSVDRRPTTITIVGFGVDESDALLGHFKHFGEITKNQLDKSVPSLTISYATRLNAEQAMLRGRVFKDKRLQVTWFNPAIPTAPQQQKIDTASIAEASENSETSAAEMAIGEDEEEEEEDAESEDRSWRR